MTGPLGGAISLLNPAGVLISARGCCISDAAGVAMAATCYQGVHPAGSAAEALLMTELGGPSAGFASIPLVSVS